jgi:acetyl/propionyl-CoA carboxylase alpha subunit/acetyl-CoA carboxylase carboxyltransferase component
MTLKSLLVANRGEIAIRIIRAASEHGIRTIAVFSEDDARSLHVAQADESRALRGSGPMAYLDIDQVIAAAKDTACDAIHPGYGFLSESANFARRCAEAGLTFVGPRPEILELFGDKGRARAFAERQGVPVLPGTTQATGLEEARAFCRSLDGQEMAIKSVAGGGGRGMRVVSDPSDLDEAYTRCQSEALSAFGSAEIYVEAFLPRARHIEVQVLGNGSGAVSHLWERDCTIQRRHQKLVELAPSPFLPAALRQRIIHAAAHMASEARFDNIGTFEFLAHSGATDGGEARGEESSGDFWFIEANPRLQVEHTVTEEITGFDLVKLQLELASLMPLSRIAFAEGPVAEPLGVAIQLRINTETMAADGSVKPSSGWLTAFDRPSGPGIRVDTFAYSGYETNPRFDSLLAKLIVHSTDFESLASRAYRALCEFRVEGVATNIPLLQNLLRHPDFLAGRIHTRFVEEHLEELSADGPTAHPRLYFTSVPSAQPAATTLAGARVDSVDPLAVLHHGKTLAAGDESLTRPAPAPELGHPGGDLAMEAPEGTVAISAPLQGTILVIDVAAGELVQKGQRLLVMEAMKMEHVISAEFGGRVAQLLVAAGDTVFEGHPLVFLEEVSEVPTLDDAGESEADRDHIRPDLAEVKDRHAVGLDSARPDAVARRRKTGQRTARENIEDLCDPDTFTEYGPLVIAAQRRRRSVEELIERTPADGLVAGLGKVNGQLFDDSRSRVIAMSYDYTVLAGTQGTQNHRKKDRMFELAEKWRLPIVFFVEGGGGRPGDTDGVGVAGLDCWAFNYFGKLSGLVPLVGIVSGRCFAGNAALLGCCDVVIATRNANIGMGGPAMIEGGGLGVFRPEEVGPTDVQAPNGVIDVLVDDEAEATRVAKRYLSYFQGRVSDWDVPDQRLLRGIVPENRRRVYDVRSVINTLADTGSVLELRRDFGHGMISALTRIEGRPLGVIANNPTHLAGAIDSAGADKATRFMQLCDAFDIPLLFLCDTPGIMVGPEVEKTALVRHASRMFVTGANLTVPLFTIILRKGYGLGAQAMAGGSFKAPVFTVAWPTGEFGGMGLEGAVKLGYRNELAAIEDPARRRADFEERVARMYEHGKAVSTASHFEIDDVIDPADSRRWIAAALDSLPEPIPRAEKKRPNIDTW